MEIKRLAGILLVSLACVLWVGCPGPQGSTGDQTGGDGTDTGTNDGTTTGGDTGTGGDVSETALSYAGVASGSVATTSSTDAAIPQTSRKLAPYAITSNASMWLTDLDGNPLKDANGQEYPHFALNTNGTFRLEGLPVGVDLIAHLDLDGDGVADLFTIFNIPKDANADTGELAGVLADPLSTLAFAKLKAILIEDGVDPATIRLSLSALIERIRDAYENLFNDSGIEGQIDLGQLAGRGIDDLAALFESLLPDAAKRGMLMARANLALALAQDVQAVVKAAAKILLQGGFVIADDPGGIDLSELAQLPNVIAMSVADFRNQMGVMGQKEQSGQAAPPPPGVPQPTLYVCTLSEVDRNFAQSDERKGPLMRPIFNEHMLTRVAAAYLAGKTIALQDLHRLMVDATKGLSVRLVFHRFVGPGQPPVEVFESSDGAGVVRSMQELFQQIQQAGLYNVTPEQWEQVRLRVRQILVAFLAGTVEPTFERMFGTILINPIPSPGDMARKLREARAHLPFSRSGPSRWWVLATADSRRNPNALPITVDIQQDADGSVRRIAYNPAGEGKFYVQHGPWEKDQGLKIGLILRKNGKPLHSGHGEPIWLAFGDPAIFAPVNSVAFASVFSETRNEYPTALILRIPNPNFDPNLPTDPRTNPKDFQVWGLLKEFGGSPVRVNYENGIVTYHESGMYYVVPGPNWWENGLFDLMKEDGQFLWAIPGDPNSRVQIRVADIQGIVINPQVFTQVFGIEVPNVGYDPTGAPYYDDINNNGVQDPSEPSFDHLMVLFNPNDWRSTDVMNYYRRADNGGFFKDTEVDWPSETPRLMNGVALVARNLRPRLNAFKFGRPNVAINLLMAFTPPETFNGTQALNAATKLNPFQAMALIDLVLESIQNLEAIVDWDGPNGPAPPHRELVPGDFFIPPLGDPLQLLAEGFEEFAK